MKSRLLVSVVAVLLAISLASCGATGGETAYDSGESNVESVESVESAESVYESLESISESDGDSGGGSVLVPSDFADNYSPLNADFNLTDKKNGASVQILLDEVRNFLSCETTAEIAPILYNHYKFESKVYYDKSVVSLSWESTGADGYKLYIADNAYFKNAATLEVNTNSCNVGFLIPGKTYYYRVADSENRRSDADFFRVSDEYSVRYISAGNYVSNMRDLGGWKTDSGKTVKYGMIYRSGHFDDMSKTDEQSRYGKFILKDILGIKTEIDLRNTSSRPGTTFIDVNFIECPMTPYSYIIPSFSYYSEQFGDSYRFFDGKTVLPSIKRVFETFADINNYPISYHCAAGADRTGTISFLLNGLLGVSYDDLMLDYELTSFSKQQRRWRSNIVGKLDEDGRMIKGDFDDLGIMEVKGSYFGFGRMFNDIMSLYGTGDGKISSAVENYLKTVCGVEQQTLDKIKTIMLI